jgi:LmbE family N-acetylglucosaminyl deacetylase
VGARVVLHVAPHPDDELVAAGATLMALRDLGLPIVNLAVALGRPEQHARRAVELREACSRAGFELRVCDPPPAISSGDDLVAAEERLVGELARVLAELDVVLVVGPHPHDGHHAHELAGRAIRRALEACGSGAPPWWAWSLWADLPLPTLVVPFDEARLQEMLAALRAHGGELERNDYERLVPARAAANAILGAERVFGFGVPGLAAPYAELVSELIRVDGRWYLAAPRVLAGDPFAGEPGGAPVDRWLTEPSVRARREAEG